MSEWVSSKMRLEHRFEAHCIAVNPERRIVGNPQLQPHPAIPSNTLEGARCLGDDLGQVDALFLERARADAPSMTLGSNPRVDLQAALDDFKSWNPDSMSRPRSFETCRRRR